MSRFGSLIRSPIITKPWKVTFDTLRNLTISGEIMTCNHESGSLSGFDKERHPETFQENFHNKKTVEKLRYNRLGRTELRISGLSIGGGGLGGFYGSVDENEAVKAVHLGLKSGLNYIDTAPWYGGGRSEEILGKALATIPRNVYYIATKVGRYTEDVTRMFDFRAERVIRSVDESLQRLGLPYVDIIQIHDLEFAPNLDIILDETLPALEKVKQSGKARFIDITEIIIEFVTPIQSILSPIAFFYDYEDVIKRSRIKVDTVLSYCRYGLLNNDLEDIIPELQERDIGILNAAPVCMGLLSDKGPPQWHAAQDSIKTACKDAVQDAKTRGFDLGTLALKKCYSSEDVTTTLISMERRDIVASNIQAVTEPFAGEERQITKEIAEKYFSALPQTHWEGIDVDKYWTKLNDPQS